MMVTINIAEAIATGFLSIVSGLIFMTEQNLNEFTTVSIPTPVCEKIQKRLAGTGLASVSDYITFVVNEIVSETDEAADTAVPFTKEDEDNVKERLRALGYID